MKTVTLQLFNQGQWWDAAELRFLGGHLSSRVSLSYYASYVLSTVEYNRKDCYACSINAPVDMIPTEYINWPALLDDILPVGKSREWWLTRLGVSRADIFTQHYALLTNACMSPIGNLRIKESVSSTTKNTLIRFPINDVIQLQHDFLEYANENGAAVGGATGAGGVAPKLLLMLEETQVYIDSDFAGKPLTAIPYLVKFARNNRTQTDNDILKAEGIFYRVLAKVLSETSIETIDSSNIMTCIDSSNEQVSLWLPRFDVKIENGIAIRLGVESIYSIVNAEPGSYQNHSDVITKLWSHLSDATTMSSSEFVKQYVARDFLNLIFGNSDNHGRNISFLKLDNDIKFAPIYDFAPMKADPEGIVRLFKWNSDVESGGNVDFRKVADELSDLCPPGELLNFLNQLALKLIDLPTMLNDLNCPEKILNLPVIGFKNIGRKLQQMGVYDG